MILSPNLAGILLYVAGSLCFVALDTTAKSLAGELHVIEIVWGRYFFNLLCILPLVPRFGLLTPLRSAYPVRQVLRSGLLFGATLLFFTALGFLPLAEATAMGHATPLVITAMAALFLGEQVGIRRWSAIVVGAIGVIIVMRPGSGALHWAAALVIAMVFFNAGYHLMTRWLARYDSVITSFWYTAIVGAGALSLIVPWFWTWPSAGGWARLAMMGLFAGVGHYLVIQAYMRVSASTVAPFAYLSIVAATISGYFVFGQLPDRWTVAGAAVIAASGLYVWHREVVRARAARAG